MCFFRKKQSKDEVLLENKQLIEKSAGQIDFLIELAAEKLQIISKLKEAQVKIKYLSPTTVKGAAQLDKKISDRLGDIKIALNKATSSGIYQYSEELIDGLAIMIAERRSISA